MAKKFFKKVLPSAVGAAVGHYTGSSLLGAAAGAGTRAISGQKTDLLTLGMDFAAGWGGTQLEGMFGGESGQGAANATPGSPAPTPAAGNRSPDVTTQHARNNNVETEPGGLLSRTVKWSEDNPHLASAAVGAAGGIGESLMQPDPEDAMKDKYKYDQKTEAARAQRIAQNYGAPPPRGLLTA